MDEKETQSQGTCHRIFSFIMKILASKVLKKATLGRLTNCSPATAPPSDDVHQNGGTKSDTVTEGSSGKPAVPDAELQLEETDISKKSDSSTSLGSLPENDQVKDDEEFPPTEGIGDAEKAQGESSAQPKAPKKMVSINDTVEDMHKIIKKRKKNKSFNRSNSLENGEDEPKPLKSILKVSSKLDENTEAYVNQNGS